MPLINVCALLHFKQYFLQEFEYDAPKFADLMIEYCDDYEDDSSDDDRFVLYRFETSGEPH